MADKKKPVDGTDENTEAETVDTSGTGPVDDARTRRETEAPDGTDPLSSDRPVEVPEADPAPEGIDSLPDSGVEDRLGTSEDTPLGEDSLGDADSLTDEDSLAATDPLVGNDTLLPGDDSLSPADPLAGDAPLDADRVTDGTDPADVTDGEAAAREEAAARGDGSQIHSAGEASLLDEQTRSESTADTVAPGAPKPATAPAPVVQERVVERKGGFVPLLLGGVVAAAIGFGASAWQSGSWPFAGPADTGFEDETRAALSDQTARIDALADEVRTATDTASGIDLSALEASVADLQSQIEAASGEYDALVGRMDALEARPTGNADIDADLQTLRDAIAAQRAEVEEMTRQAIEAEASAQGQAALAQARAALAEVRAALTEGEPYEPALSTIRENGFTVPEALEAPASEGVPTLAALTEDFPPLARDALAAARRAEAGAESATARFTTFLSNQVGLRSVTPREGGSPDAVLSRAEAALRAGDLPGTLSELETLSEEARAPLSDWIARARTRADAVAAADAVAQELNNG